MKKNPTLVFTGLAVAAVAAVVGLTRDRWLAPGPGSVPPIEISKSEQVPAAEPTTAPATTETQPVAETPAVTTEQAAVETPAEPEKSAAPAETAEAPAATTETKTAETQPAETEAPAAAAVETKAAEAPSFDTVRVEKSGEALIAGRAEPGAEVAAMLDGKLIGSAVANADGAFVIIPDGPLPPGSGALTIEAKLANQTVATKSGETVAVIVPADTKQDALVAVVSPDAPTKILQKSEPQPEPEATVVAEAPAAETVAEQPAVEQPAVEQPAVEQPVVEQPAAEEAPAEQPVPAKLASRVPVSLDAVDYDDAGNIVFSGRGTPGTTARLYVDNALAGDAKADGDGRWSFAGTAPITTGKHMLRVDGIDEAGRVTGRVELPFFREQQEKVVAATTEQPAAETTTATTEDSKPKDGRIVIQPGNNLWRISRVIYGSGTKYTVLFDANKEQIRDPDLIYPGQVFMTPEVVPPETIDPKLRDPITSEDSAAIEK